MSRCVKLSMVHVGVCFVCDLGWIQAPLVRVQTRQPWVSSHVKFNISKRAVEQMWPSHAPTECVGLQTTLIPNLASPCTGCVGMLHT